MWEGREYMIRYGKVRDTWWGAEMAGLLQIYGHSTSRFSIAGLDLC